jgi:hypothetical protein
LFAAVVLLRLLQLGDPLANVRLELNVLPLQPGHLLGARLNFAARQLDLLDLLLEHFDELLGGHRPVLQPLHNVGGRHL